LFILCFAIAIAIAFAVLMLCFALLCFFVRSSIAVQWTSVEIVFIISFHLARAMCTCELLARNRAVD